MSCKVECENNVNDEGRKKKDQAVVGGNQAFKLKLRIVR